MSLRRRGNGRRSQSVADWYGSGHWMKNGVPLRAVTLQDDAELITRHEVQRRRPDLLVTNYSMLEYMMLRPIERSIFEATANWLAAYPDETFLLVLDEAHLYRGAQGAEVGLLLRRLRERLDIPADRFQVICATASFSDEGKANAGAFGAQLSGVDPELFRTGLRRLTASGPPKQQAATPILASWPPSTSRPSSPKTRRPAPTAIAPFLAYQGVAPTTDQNADLFHALKHYGPFAKLVNETMRAARSFNEIRDLVFGHRRQACRRPRNQRAARDGQPRAPQP